MPEMTPQDIADCLETITERRETNKMQETVAMQAANYIRRIANGELRPVVHAHWIAYKRSYVIPYPGIDEYKCSNCGCRRSVKSKYCKDCGALMDEKEI